MKNTKKNVKNSKALPVARKVKVSYQTGRALWIKQLAKTSSAAITAEVKATLKAVKDGHASEKQQQLAKQLMRGGARRVMVAGTSCHIGGLMALTGIADRWRVEPADRSKVACCWPGEAVSAF